ncbi:MAG: LysR substrate-binding domain-containing protein, partial [Acidimicrobiia bacterium]
QFQLSRTFQGPFEIPMHMLTNIALVAAGVGLSVVPASMTGIHESRVVYRRLDPRLRLEAPLNLVSQARTENAVLKRFIELVTAGITAARSRRARTTSSRS